MLIGCAGVPDSRVEHAKAIAASASQALEHYRAAVGHYPESLSALRATDLEAAGRDTAALRSIAVTIEHDSTPDVGRWSYQSDHTTYSFMFSAGPDSVRRLDKVWCGFRPAGNTTCTWERRIPQGFETDTRTWGPIAAADAWREVVGLAIVLVPVIVLAVVLSWRGERAVDSLPALVVGLDVVASTLALLLPSPPEHSTMGIVTTIVVTCALWSSLAVVLVLKAVHSTSRFALASSALIVGVAAAWVVSLFLGIICIFPPGCL